MDRELRDNACNVAQTVVTPVNDNSILTQNNVVLCDDRGLYCGQINFMFSLLNVLIYKVYIFNPLISTSQDCWVLVRALRERVIGT